jgi:hypothetical protein
MKIPVIQMTANQPEAQVHPRYSDSCTLPASYMSEYSVLGLVVDEIDRAIEILMRNGLQINREEFGAEVEIIGPEQLPDVVRILAEAGIDCSIGDVIDSVYQG